MLITRYKRPQYTGMDIFNEFLNNIGTYKETAKENIVDFNPSVNTRESEDAYYIEVDLPGVKKEDVDINIEENILTISGKRKLRKEVKEENYYKIESTYGTFTRSFTLPQKIDLDKIEATTHDGVLEITIAKQKELVNKSKKIEIK